MRTDFTIMFAVHRETYAVWMLKSHVNRQVVLVRIGLLAKIASIRLLSSVNVLVLEVLGPRQEAFVAQFALVAVLFGVSSTMAFQVRFLVARIIADVADELLQASVY